MFSGSFSETYYLHILDLSPKSCIRLANLSWIGGKNMIVDQVLHELVTIFQMKDFQDFMWFCRGLEYDDRVLLLKIHLLWV